MADDISGLVESVRQATEKTRELGQTHPLSDQQDSNGANLIASQKAKVKSLKREIDDLEKQLSKRDRKRSRTDSPEEDITNLLSHTSSLSGHDDSIWENDESSRYSSVHQSLKVMRSVLGLGGLSFQKATVRSHKDEEKDSLFRHFFLSGHALIVPFQIRFRVNTSTNEVSQLTLSVPTSHLSELGEFRDEVQSSSNVQHLLSGLRAYAEQHSRRTRIFTDLAEQGSDGLSVEVGGPTNRRLYLRNHKSGFGVAICWRITLGAIGHLSNSVECIPLCSSKELATDSKGVIGRVPSAFKLLLKEKGIEDSISIMWSLVQGEE